MKNSQALQDAEQLVESRRLAVQIASEALERAKEDLNVAIRAQAAAFRVEDDKLPRCKMVNIGWRSGMPRDAVQDMVVVRKTSGGMLVARRYGEPLSREFKFKWAEIPGAFRQAEKQVTVLGDVRELRDVPKEFLPA